MMVFVTYWGAGAGAGADPQHPPLGAADAPQQSV